MAATADLQLGLEPVTHDEQPAEPLDQVQYDLILDVLGIREMMRKAERTILVCETLGEALGLLRLKSTLPLASAPPPESSLIPAHCWDRLRGELGAKEPDDPLSLMLCPLELMRMRRLITGAQQIYDTFARMPREVSQLAGWESGTGALFRRRLLDYRIDTVRNPGVTPKQAKLVALAFLWAANMVTVNEAN